MDLNDDDPVQAVATQCDDESLRQLPLPPLNVEQQANSATVGKMPPRGVIACSSLLDCLIGTGGHVEAEAKPVSPEPVSSEPGNTATEETSPESSTSPSSPDSPPGSNHPELALPAEPAVIIAKNDNEDESNQSSDGEQEGSHIETVDDSAPATAASEPAATAASEPAASSSDEAPPDTDATPAETQTQRSIARNPSYISVAEGKKRQGHENMLPRVTFFLPLLHL